MLVEGVDEMMLEGLDAVLPAIEADIATNQGLTNKSITTHRQNRLQKKKRYTRQIKLRCDRMKTMVILYIKFKQISQRLVPIQHLHFMCIFFFD